MKSRQSIQQGKEKVFKILTDVRIALGITKRNINDIAKIWEINYQIQMERI